MNHHIVVAVVVVNLVVVAAVTVVVAIVVVVVKKQMNHHSAKNDVRVSEAKLLLIKPSYIKIERNHSENFNFREQGFIKEFRP